MLTVREQEIFNAIKTYISIYGIPPSMKDIAEREKISVARVKYYLDILHKKKYIKKTDKIARSLVILKEEL